MRTTPKSQVTLSELGSVTGKWFTAILIILATSLVASAQDPASSPAPTLTPSAAETRLTQENTLLELEKKNAQLKKEIREAQPQPSATPLEGKTTVDENVIMETQMVTYKAMSEVADRLGDEIFRRFGGAKSIAIFDAEELQNLNRYRAMFPMIEGMVDGLKEQYSTVFRELSKIPRVETSNRSAVSSISPNRTSALTSITVTGSEASAMVANVSSAATAIPPEPVSSALLGLRAFADLLALARTDTEIKGKSVSVEENAIVAETFRALRNRFGTSLNLYYPKAVSPELNLENCQQGNDRTFCSPILSSLASLYAKKEEADKKIIAEMHDVTSGFERATVQKNTALEDLKVLTKQISDIKTERLKAELAKPWTSVQIRKFERFVKELEAQKNEALSQKSDAEAQLESIGKKKNLLEMLQTLNQRAGEMAAQLAAPDEKTGHSELADFLRAENIDKTMGEGSYWLEVKSISAGGNNRTRKNLFRYFSGAKLDHSGGIIMAWNLYDRNGVSVDSNKDSSYGGYQTPKQIVNAGNREAVSDQTQSQSQSVAKSGKQ
jgi:hypothetical protein